jgi:hypothetical protein
MTGMATETPTATAPKADMTVEEKVNKLRELFADAPEVGKTALEKVLSRLASDASQKQPPPVESAGRVGARPRVDIRGLATVPRRPAQRGAIRGFALAEQQVIRVPVDHLTGRQAQRRSARDRR